MKNNYYQNPISDNNSRNNKEISYSDVLNMNQGKIATFYMNYNYNSNNENLIKEFKGIIESASYDHVIISDPKTGKWTLLPLMYLNYIIFEENINF